MMEAVTEKYVNDYQGNLFNIAFPDRKVIEKFKSDFWFLADYFWQLRKNGIYYPAKRYMKHPREVLVLLSDLTKDRRFLEIYEMQNDGRRKTMCEYLDMLEKRGETRGIKIGEKRGERRGERRGVKRGKKQEDARWRKLILKLAEEGKQSLIIDAAENKQLFDPLYQHYMLQEK